MTKQCCRHCHAPLTLPLVDLGSAPPSNAYLSAADLNTPEIWYPLRVLICEHCWLVQTQDFTRPEMLFCPDYAYFSSFSTTWLNHAAHYVENVIKRFGLNATHRIIEIAANDGYLLQYVQAHGIPCIGIEPTAATAIAARAKGLTIVEEFFGFDLAITLTAQNLQADLIVANNVLAHVPDINNFIRGIVQLLKPHGVATFEFPHLLNLLTETQFDTLYHEHFSYLSLSVVVRIFQANGLQVFDVEELSTHGGSLRVYAQRIDTGIYSSQPHLAAVLKTEQSAGLETQDGYANFQKNAELIRQNLLRFLLDAQQRSKQVVGYGAAAKGNTLLNYAGVRPDLLCYVVDRNPAKQNRYLPGSRIPIVDEAHLTATRPDYVLILPWNLRDEVMQQLDYIRTWGAKFVTAVPSLQMY